MPFLTYVTLSAIVHLQNPKDRFSMLCRPTASGGICNLARCYYRIVRHYEREKEFWPIINRGLLRLLSLVLLIGIVGGRRVTRLLRLAQWHSVNDARGGISGVRIGMRARYVLKSRNKKTINFHSCVDVNLNRSNRVTHTFERRYKDLIRFNFFLQDFIKFYPKKNPKRTFLRSKCISVLNHEDVFWNFLYHWNNFSILETPFELCAWTADKKSITYGTSAEMQSRHLRSKLRNHTVLRIARIGRRYHLYRNRRISMMKK